MVDRYVTMPAKLTEEEQALFLAHVSDANPLKASPRADLAPKPPRPVARQRHLDDQAVLHELIHAPIQLADRLEGGDEPTYLHRGVSMQVLRDLRRGRWVVQNEIDLHGHTRDAAREALSKFLSRCLLQGQRCVRVVTGRGLRSPGQVAVLRTLTRNWLIQRHEVLAYCQAKPVDGGEGALMVLLRNQHRAHPHETTKDET